MVKHALEDINAYYYIWIIVYFFKDCSVPYILEDVMALNATSTLYTSISFSLDCSQISNAQAEYSNMRGLKSCKTVMSCKYFRQKYQICKFTKFNGRHTFHYAVCTPVSMDMALI